MLKRQTRFTPFSKSNETADFGRPRTLLYMNWAAVQSVLSSRSSLNQMKMDMDALDHYLRNSQYFLGVKQQRFVVLTANGAPDVEYKVVEGRNVKNMKYTRPMALVFDYEMLKAAADIDLETYIAPEFSLESDPDEQQDESPGDSPPKEQEQQSLFSQEVQHLPF